MTYEQWQLYCRKIEDIISVTKGSHKHTLSSGETLLEALEEIKEHINKSEPRKKGN